MVIALDFDGVISNSLVDGMITAQNVYIKMFPQSLIMSRDILSVFTELRPYVENAGDFYAVMKSIEEGKKFASQEEFDAYVSSFDKQLIKKFYQEFYVERYLLQQKDIKKWCEINPPYKEIVQQLKNVNMDEVYIVTSKDYRSVSVLMNYYGLPVGADHILDNTIKDKLFKLKVLGVPLKGITFVEDLLANILPIRKTSPVKCFLATWGFNNEVQREIAKKEGINLINEKDFNKVLNIMGVR